MGTLKYQLLVEIHLNIGRSWYSKNLPQWHMYYYITQLKPAAMSVVLGLKQRMRELVDV